METKRRKTGFTIVELLTVMAIIAILMGLLVPAMQQVRKLAKDTSQKAQFHSIDVALVTYSNDSGGMNEEYPESTMLNGAAKSTIGSQRLAEALIGRDMLGFDPKSSGDADVDDANDQVYANEALPLVSSAEKIKASLDRRQGPYLNPESVEAFQLGQLFPTCEDATAPVYGGDLSNAGVKDAARVAAPVLTDSYRVKRVTMPNGKTIMAGTPILYFKANTQTTAFMDVTIPANFTAIDAADANDAGYIYNIYDNDELVKLYQMMKPTNLNRHHFDEAYTESINGSDKNGVWIFYNTITNPKITSQPRPYNMNSYILMSAGADGVYGTRDDIYNF